MKIKLSPAQTMNALRFAAKLHANGNVNAADRIIAAIFVNSQ